MNIFCTYDNPIQSALALDDRRVNKMITESAQMLSTAINHYWGGHNTQLYKSVSYNHQCNKWVRYSRQNFDWLVDHALALHMIYKHKSGRNHYAHSIILKANEYREMIPSRGLTPFANATEFKSEADLEYPITELYRRFMNLKWTTRDGTRPTWFGREKPNWALV